MKYDLTVFGGGTSGVAAAYIASKYGLNTLLVEKSDVLGGAITRGLVVPAMKLDTGNINTEFFNDLCAFSDKYNARHTYIDGNEGWFNPEILKTVLDDMLTSVGCRILFSSEPSQISYSDVFDINLSHKLLSLHIETKYIVDATSEGKIFKILNCDFQKKSDTKQMPSLRFIVSDIDMKEFADWLLKTDSDRNVTSVEFDNDQIYLSTACTFDKTRNWALFPLFEDAVKSGVLTEQEASYFQVFSVPDMPSSLAFNCPRIFPDGDIDDPFVYSKALIQGRKSVLRIHDFCKKYFPGFENSAVSHISDMLGIRESSRVKCKYTYTTDDIASGKTFDNIAFMSDYPVDIHSKTTGGDVLKRPPGAYAVPVETLISDKYDRLYCAGRIISADFEAQAAVRTQQNCFSMGEACAKNILLNFNK